MALELRDCTFYGPALPEPFVKFQLERELNKRNLLGRTTGPEGRALEERWEVFRRKLRQLGEQGGDRRVANHVLEPLIERLGYASLERQAAVITREGAEDGGWLFSTPDGKKLRGWAVSLGTDLDAPNRRGRAYRFSPSRVAQRVLLASGERMGLLTDGEELRILLCDPARPDSHIGIRLDRAGGWRAARALPDSYRLLLALASPAGVAALQDLTDAARLAQSSVTKKLRLQARRAIEGFLQELLDHPDNQSLLGEQGDRQQLAWRLWSEGLISVYRLLFVFKLEASADPARAFSFAATSLWRNTYSPNTALADLVRRVLDEGKESGGFLEAGLRTLWRLFAEGMSSSELEIKPLGGMLFGRGATPLLDQLKWGEQAVARLLDALLWTPGEGGAARERVHYGALDVEDLGRVYESLLELEPGISGEAMCRLRRAKLEVVVPVAQGEPYRANQASAEAPETPDDEVQDEESDEPAEETGRRSRAAAGSKTKVEFIEEIPADRFFLRVGLGRKASGSYYTPHPFVRFLVQETLGVLLVECSPRENPQPALILRLKVLDSAMGSGHFLVEACRFLGEGLYEACRLCDELAVQAEEQAEKVEGPERESLLTRAAELRQRVEDLPDPNNELLAYLPSRAAEGEESGLSQKKAEAMCRRLVAVHCLYGVDKNPLAVELAKLSLWLESYAEGLPLTFLDHRLICGDSLTGPFFEHLLTYPKSGGRLDDLFAQGLTQRLQDTLAAALVHVRDLEASVGKDLADLNLKESAKAKLDEALAPLKTLAAAWSGSVMLGDDCDDSAYQFLAEAVGSGKTLELKQEKKDVLDRMINTGSTSVPYQLLFPEVFFRSDGQAGGFDAVIGNPPWDKPIVEAKSFFSEYLPWILDGSGKAEWEGHAQQLLRESEKIASRFTIYQRQQVAPVLVRARIDNKISSGNAFSGGHPEMFALFIDKAISELASSSRGSVAFVVGGGFISNASSEKARAQILSDAFPRYIYQFDNRKSLFVDLPSILEFCVFVCDRKPRQEGLRFALRLDDFEDIYGDKGRVISSTEIKAAASNRFILGGSAEGTATDSFLTALRDHMGITLTAEADPAKTDYHVRIADILGDATADARQPHVAAQLNSLGYLPFRISPSIYLYDDSPPQRHSRWSPFLTSAVSIHDPLIGRSLKAVRYYRLTVRRKCGSPKSNERSLVSVVIPPGYICSNNLMSERLPGTRPNYVALAAEAVWNAFTPDSNARRIISTTFGLTQMSAVGFPALSQEILGFLAHGALRLTCNHSGYADLWKEQLGDAWRECKDRWSWPVLAGGDERLQVMSTIDAVVARCYGISLSTYAQILDSFEHRRYPGLPLLCLQAFDELIAIGIDSFRRKHDPYWDVCLNESLPQPSIDLPDDGCEASTGSGLGPLFESLSNQDLPREPWQTASPSSAAEASFITALPVRASGNGAFPTIAELLRSRGVITSSDAQQATGLDAAGVRPHLRQLVQQGLAVTEGQRRGMRYRRVDG
jgi:hypothetical protein